MYSLSCAALSSLARAPGGWPRGWRDSDIRGNISIISRRSAHRPKHGFLLRALPAHLYFREEEYEKLPGVYEKFAADAERRWQLGMRIWVLGVSKYSVIKRIN